MMEATLEIYRRFAYAVLDEDSGLAVWTDHDHSLVASVAHADREADRYEYVNDGIWRKRK